MDYHGISWLSNAKDCQSLGEHEEVLEDPSAGPARGHHLLTAHPASSAVEICWNWSRSIAGCMAIAEADLTYLYISNYTVYTLYISDMVVIWILNLFFGHEAINRALCVLYADTLAPTGSSPRPLAPCTADANASPFAPFSGFNMVQSFHLPSGNLT